MPVTKQQMNEAAAKVMGEEYPETPKNGICIGMVAFAAEVNKPDIFDKSKGDCLRLVKALGEKYGGYINQELNTDCTDFTGLWEAHTLGPMIGTDRFFGVFTTYEEAAGMAAIAVIKGGDKL